MNSWMKKWTNTIFPLGTYRCDSQTKRSRWWANEKLAAKNMKKRELFFFPFVWMRSYKLLWKEEQRQTEQSMQTHPAQVLPMLPQSRDLFASHNYYVLELALGAQSFPLLIFPLLTSAISFWQSSPFILFSLQVWLLAVPAEGKVFYKTLISFSLIPFF